MDRDWLGAAVKELTDAEVFGKELTDEEVFGKTNAINDTASAVIKGLQQGGPPMAVAKGLITGVPPLVNYENKAIERGAYRGGGAVTDFASQAGASPEIAGGLGYGANVTLQAIPMLAGGEVARPLSMPLKSMGEWLMGSALKPTYAARQSGKADRAISTMLDEGINATEGGVDKMQGIISDLNSKVKDIISNSSEMVKKSDVVNYLQDVVKRFSNRPNAIEARGEVQSAADQFLNHPMVAGQSDIPIQTAQKLKQGYQASVGDKGYGELKTATTESEKAIARGLREEISRLEPTVGPLNKRESDLINAVKIASRRAGMEQNNNPLGLALLAPDTTSFISFLADKWGLSKSIVARALYSGDLPAHAARGGIALSEINNQQGGFYPQY